MRISSGKPSPPGYSNEVGGARRVDMRIRVVAAPLCGPAPEGNFGKITKSSHNPPPPLNLKLSVPSGK